MKRVLNINKKEVDLKEFKPTSYIDSPAYQKFSEN